MNRIETILKAVLAALLLPGLLLLLGVLGWGVVTASDFSGRLALAGVFVFLAAGGLVAIRILFHRPRAFVGRLRKHAPGTPEYVEVGLHYIRSRSGTLKLTAAFCLLLFILHTALPFVSDLAAHEMVIMSISTFGLPVAAAYLFFRREAAFLDLLRAASQFSQSDRQRALLFLAKHRPESEEVSSIVVKDLEELGVEAAWPEHPVLSSTESYRG